MTPEYRPDWLIKLQKHFPGTILRVEVPRVKKHEDGILLDEDALAENHAEHLELDDE